MEIPGDYKQISQKVTTMLPMDELTLETLMKKNNRRIYQDAEWIKFSGSLGWEAPRNVHPNMRPRRVRVRGGYWS